MRFVFGLLAGDWTGLSPVVPPNAYGSVIPTSDAEHANCYALSLSCSLLDLVEYQRVICEEFVNSKTCETVQTQSKLKY